MCVNVIVISGACCNPSLKVSDQEMLDIFELAAKELQISILQKVVSISSIAIGGLFFSDEMNQKITAIIKNHGTSVLPLAVIDGTKVVYGNIPQLEEAKLLLDHACSK